MQSSEVNTRASANAFTHVISNYYFRITRHLSDAAIKDRNPFSRIKDSKHIITTQVHKQPLR
jgi:hypothetical protein